MPAPSRAIVHLDRLRANVEGVRARVGDRQVMAAVKADAYGHGAVEVARFLEEERLVDWFGVATVPEAMELRRAGVRTPMLKLSHVLTDAGALACVDEDVVTACVGADNARMLSHAAGRLGRPARVHLKVDTGMGRIGVRPEDAAAVAREVDRMPGVSLEGLFSHLPVGDDPEQDDFTSGQVATFRRVVDEVHEALGRELEHVHLANSGGVLAHEDAWFTMVRPGIMLWGCYPDAATPRTVPLEPVLEWRSVVSFVKSVPAGVTVGYGRTDVADVDRRVATVPVGYADGYPRLLSNRGEVLVRGRRARVAGRVCMDQLMVEVADDVRVGDEVVVIGRQGDEQVGADDVAALAGTISYEVLCAIGARVEREYARGDR